MRPVGKGVIELKINHGPGYRVYIGQIGKVYILLLCAGSKRTQESDITMAKKYFGEYIVNPVKNFTNHPDLFIENCVLYLANLLEVSFDLRTLSPMKIPRRFVNFLTGFTIRKGENWREYAIK